jgi:hypothetical protein
MVGKLFGFSKPPRIQSLWWVIIIFPMTSMAILWLLTVHRKIAGEPRPKRRETNSSAPSLGSSAATSHFWSAEKLGQKKPSKKWRKFTVSW